MQEHVQWLSHMDLLVSQIPITVLQCLHIGIAQEIQFHVESSSTELEKVAVKNTKLQQEYAIALKEKTAAGEKDDRILKEKIEAEEKADRMLKEKREVEEKAKRVLKENDEDE